MDTSSLSPADAAVALRSFPRRFRETTALEPGESPERMHEQPGILVRSVADLATDAVRSLALLDRALEQILLSDAPALHPAVTDRERRDFSFAGHGDLDDVLSELDDVAPAFADRIGRVPADDWNRTATVAGGDGSPVTALQVVQEAVSTAADDLRDIEATMRQFRGR
jgi:hypothetical protein